MDLHLTQLFGNAETGGARLVKRSSHNDVALVCLNFKV
jgi:hypothetical protein